MAAVHDKRGIAIGQLDVRRAPMDAAVSDACVSGYEDLIDALKLPDPNDRHVLATAIRCHANGIVTFNEKDFPEATISKLGIHTRHPDDFILDVDGLHPGTLLDAAKADRAHYKEPPLSVESYVDGLRACGLPKTADLLHNVCALLGQE